VKEEEKSLEQMNKPESTPTTEGHVRTNLSDYLILYSRRTEDPLRVVYEVENTSLSPIEFTLSLTGSENFYVVPFTTATTTATATASAANLPPHHTLRDKCTDMTLVARITPFLRLELGHALMVDEERRATLRVSCEWHNVDPNPAELDEAMHLSRLRVMQAIQQSERCNYPSILEDPQNKELAALFAKTSVLFVDSEFKPNENCLYPKLTTADGRNFCTMDGQPFQKSIPYVEFKRARDFFEGEFNVFLDSIVAEDIRQGALGDCWFLSALAAMTEFPELIRDLFPKESQERNHYGAYNVRFCKNGMWSTVRVDDFFPCYPGAGPMFSRSHGNELWVLLAEKAFAKIHGNYAALRSGWVYEALMDLTGSPCQTFRLDDDTVKAKVRNVLDFLQ
jgi:hypothetical protein